MRVLLALGVDSFAVAGVVDNAEIFANYPDAEEGAMMPRFVRPLLLVAMLVALQVAQAQVKPAVPAFIPACDLQELNREYVIALNRVRHQLDPMRHRCVSTRHSSCSPRSTRRRWSKSTHSITLRLRGCAMQQNSLVLSTRYRVKMPKH